MNTFFKEIWSFFASVKLALFVFIALAVTSIIGTVIPQGENAEFYVQNFGPGAAKVFALLNIPNMYGSSWFISLLVLFCINLTVCSFERIPRVWKLVRQDNLDTDPDRIEKMRTRETFHLDLPLAAAAEQVKLSMTDIGWKGDSREIPGGVLLFSQKGAWSRFGVYVVHLSILIIFLGAIIGAVSGYKASIMLPEGSTTEQIFQNNAGYTALPLGFGLRCNSFGIDYYDNGTPKEYWSNLTVLENGKEVLNKIIQVNDPLQYNGLTFYQSSYQSMDNQYLVDITNTESGTRRKFIIRPGVQNKWNEEQLSFGILATNPDGHGHGPYKIWFSDGKARPSQFMINDDSPVNIQRPETTYGFMVRQRFSTGLQIAKDPGVWWVYAGCSFMLVGLMIVFFLSHRRVWVLLRSAGEGTQVIASGLSNKNKLGFEKTFDTMVSGLKTNTQQFMRMN